MKKFVTLATVIVFVFTLAAVTYAIDFKLSGMFRTRTAVGVNAYTDYIQATSAAFDDTASEVDSRIRLKVDAVASEALKATLYLQGDGEWGRDGMAVFGAGQKEVKIKHAFVTFAVPGLEDYATELDVGVQSFYLARFGIDDDVPGVTIDTKFEPAELRLIWVKDEEGDIWSSDVKDSYGFRLTYPIGDWRPGVWFQWDDFGSAPRTVADGTPNVRTSGDLWYIGFTADGKIGPVSFIGDFVYNGGSIDLSVPAAFGDEQDYGGWMVHAKASMPVGDMYEVGALFMYASGDDETDKATKGDINGFRQPRGGASFRPTQVYYGSSTNDSVGLVSRAGVRAYDPTGKAGDWLLQVFGSAKPLDWLKVTLAAAYIGDNVDEGDRVGTSTDAAGALEDNSDIGFEIDAIASIQIYKELVLDVAGGMLFAGDALETTTGVAGVNDEPDNPWVIVTKLEYSF